MMKEIMFDEPFPEEISKDPRLMASTYAEQRFWEKVHFAKDGCWEWRGAHSRHADSSGVFNASQSEGMVRAAGFAWRMANPSFDIRDKRVFFSMCGKRSCVRPSHLLLTTRYQVMRGLLDTMGARYRMTECKRGHQLVDDNLMRTDSGLRCKACADEYKVSFIVSYREGVSDDAHS